MSSQYAFYVPADFAPTSSFYIFDLDGTIVFSKSGKLSGSDAADTLILPSVPKLFSEIRALGHTILVVSNQAYWTDGAKEKIQYVHTTLNVPIAVATGKLSPYRKPSPLIWNTFKATYNVNPAKITMVGDAVGPADPYIPYRWASSDADFAKNIGATFVRPSDIIPGSGEPQIPEGLSIILMVGNPGSGKSTFAAELAEKTGAEHIEQDNYPSRSKVLATAKTILRTGRSVIIDATHGNKERRNEVYAIAKECNATPHIIWFPRDGRPFNKERTTRIVPGVAYGTYTKYFSDPREDGMPISVMY